jgi:hypothetical protein
MSRLRRRRLRATGRPLWRFLDMSVWPLRYRHGHETVEAFRWAGDDIQREGPQWAADALDIDMMRLEEGGPLGVRLLVRTPAGWATAAPGGWIVRGPSLDMEVCSDVEFRRRCAAIPRLTKKADARRDLSSGSHRRKRKLPLTDSGAMPVASSREGRPG